MTSDANFFDVFQFDFVDGDRSSALRQPFSVVITESTAKRYFGNDAALNKVVTVPGIGEVKVTGVIKDPPTNSHLQFDVLFTSLRSDSTWNAYLNDWNSYNAFTYIVAQDDKSMQDLEAKMPAFLKKTQSAGC